MLGCFILFSANVIAQGLMTGASFARAEPVPPPAPPAPAYEPTPPPPPQPYDPYAGAAVSTSAQRDLFR